MDCSPPGSSVHGILQERILERVAMPSSGDLPDPGIKPVSLTSPALTGEVFFLFFFFFFFYHQSHGGSLGKCI